MWDLLTALVYLALAALAVAVFVFVSSWGLAMLEGLAPVFGG